MKKKNKWIKGIKIVISISKIRKISLIIKKWLLKGICLEENGSNPHSKGEIFSREEGNFLEIKKLIKRSKNARVRAKKIGIINMIIIYIKFF